MVTSESDKSTIKSISTNNIHMAASSYKGTEIWLTAIPSRSVRTFLSNENFRVSCGVRIGGFLCKFHQSRCGANAGLDGLHCLSCNKSMGRISRHNEINDIIASI